MRSKPILLGTVALIGCLIAGAPARAEGSVSILGTSPQQQCAADAAAAVSASAGSGAVSAHPRLAGCNEALKAELTRDRVAAYLNRGVIREASADHAGAISDFNKALALDPTLSQAYVDRGVVYAGLRDPGAAVADFTQALALNTDHVATVLFDRALAYEDEGEMKAAYLDYLNASRLAPNWAEPKEQLARFTVAHRGAQS